MFDVGQSDYVHVVSIVIITVATTAAAVYAAVVSAVSSNVEPFVVGSLEFGPD